MSAPHPQLSVVVPAFNEQDSVVALAHEIAETLRGTIAFEMVFVDDHSSDGTLAALRAVLAHFPELRVLRHAQRSGQSMAVRNGAKAARGGWIATLDGDGQNQPADIARLIAARKAADPRVKCFAGWRMDRRDGAIKRLTSRIANAVRSRILHDATPDSGCGLKLFERAAFLELPCFDHMHRFLPALFQRDGWQVLSVPVGHRPRRHGVSKYGTWNRLWVGIADLRGVGWLIRRARHTVIEEYTGE